MASRMLVSNPSLAARGADGLVSAALAAAAADVKQGGEEKDAPVGKTKEGEDEEETCTFSRTEKA